MVSLMVQTSAWTLVTLAVLMMLCYPGEVFVIKYVIIKSYQE